ncbi:MAG TPA: carboxylating nicotinate-nucleotide diphosphorylase [Dokdonella sp.]|uniref:carboxylating nicotinate-nucleotide diphosphorylase n=1 Tax=Dokdonella sp. TaxID=2291710 RepID=UPI002D7ED05D|nr:carboxylating nicotinate-nucleotide diphosphorylase [Dokdonella sp.]HET9031869.1 carboxylating nicotinate-nucleotide diphosphorylase [Dokdonella sp.]
MSDAFVPHPDPAPRLAVAAIDPELIHNNVLGALAEDLGSGDVTADLLPAEQIGEARILTRESAIICGQAWVNACFQQLDGRVKLDWLVSEGAHASAGQVLCTVSGPMRAIVSAERSALNFLQTLSATATTTATYVNAIRHTRTRILDTRKTLPGLRHAQKYAVRIGGGMNHRMGLYDAILIKENHIAAAGSLSSAVGKARSLHPSILVEVEVETFSELREALAAGVDRIMLDEFELEELAQAVTETDGRTALEVSGGVGLDRVRAIAETGVDYISIGALTKHVRAIDLSMRVVLAGDSRHP